MISLITILVFPLQLSCQSSNQKIDFESPDAVLLEKLIVDKINAIRKKHKLLPFKQDPKLGEAAKNQAKYNYKNNQVSSAQVKKSMATPFLRVNQLDGNYARVEEVNNMVVIGVKVKVKGQKKRTVLKSYAAAANAIVSEWEYSKALLKILKNEDFYNLGVGVVFVPGENLIYTTADLGVEPYIKSPGVKYSSNSYKLRPYAKNDCKNFEREFGYLSELFSSSIHTNNDSILFKFHDLNLIKSILKTRKDGFAIDIINRDQFDCSSGNRAHPAAVEDGILLKPTKKGKLLRKNPLKEEKKFIAYLGRIPEGVDIDDIELNLLIIQNKCNCSAIQYNNIDSKNLRLLEVDFTIDTISISENIDSLSKQLNFSIPFEKNKAEYQVEDIKPILDSIQLNRYDIKQINITAYSSIEGNQKSNEILQMKRAESMLSAIQEYQLQKVKTSINTFENWDGFKQSIKDSPYYQDFKSLTKEETRSLINSDTLQYDLEPYLETQRKAEINIIVESIYIDSLTPKLLPKKFIKAIEDGEHIIAKGIQSLMLRNVEQGIMEKATLFPTKEIPYTRENMPIMNNILAFKLKYFNGNSDELDSLFEDLKTDVGRFLTIDPNNAHLNYNKQLVELYYWSRNIHYLMIDKEAKVDQPRDLYKAIRRLYNSKIDNWKVNQLLLNYYLIAADFYYETQNYVMREKSLKKVKKLVIKSKLNQEQTYIMAGYFMFQIHMDWAIQIMLPFIKREDYNEDFIFRLISIAIYDEKKVPPANFMKLLNTAKEMNERRFCELFGAPNMSFQLLSKDEIKESYCKTCNSY